MFPVPVFSLLSAIRRDPFAVSFTAPRDLCPSRIPFACFRPIVRAEKWRAKKCKTTRICQASQNEHFQKRSYNSLEMSIYRIIGLETAQNQHLQERGGWGCCSDPFTITTDRAMINIP